MRRLLRDQSGIALIVALGVLVVISILVVSLIGYTTANQHAGQLSANDLQAKHYAEGALNGAYSIILNTNAGGSNASAPNLLGCSGTTAPSDCSSPTPRVFCIGVNSPCTAGTAGTASVYGYYSGTNPQTFNGTSVPASTWLLVATGYASNPNTDGVTAQSETATVVINPLSSGAVASVWNHVFLTAPLVPNQCQTTFSGNSLILDVPLYVIGNLCVAGNSDVIEEVGQPVDLQVGGKLVLSGNSSSVGVNASTPITSGVVVGGCTTVSVSSATTACTPASYKYWVKTADTFNTQAAPSETSTDIQNDYNTFDPGPMHACQSGTNPAPLPSSTFDNDTTYNDSAATFELTPNFSYSCLSQSGASVGQLTWDNVAKKLTINGSIFIDGNMTISHSLYYVGTAVIEVAGTVTVNNNSTTICGTSPCNTNLNAWQGSSGNTSMLTLAPLASNTTAMTMGGNSQIFQGSLWTQPSSAVLINGNSVTVEGPLSIGTLNLAVNSTSIKPLPVIKNMPVGAPLPPNAGVSISSIVYTR